MKTDINTGLTTSISELKSDLRFMITKIEDSKFKVVKEEYKALKAYCINLDNYLNELDSETIDLDADTSKYLDYWYNDITDNYLEGLESDKNEAVKTDKPCLSDRDKMLSRQFCMDVITFLDFLQVDKHLYNDTYTLEDGRAVSWSLELSREGYIFTLDGVAVNKPYISMVNAEVVGLYERLRVAISVKLRFINLNIVVKGGRDV